MNIEQSLAEEIRLAVKQVFGVDEKVILQPTRKEFEGDYTYVFFGLVKGLRKSPGEIGNAIGDYLVQNAASVTAYNVVQGFLNIKLADAVWIEVFRSLKAENRTPTSKNKVLVEYSSPNTNKPLHLGHLRNNFLGYSVAEILKAAGHEVIKACLVNDRGIHICKSMVAYQHFGNTETPQSTGLKGDHLVGKYYVEFDKEIKKQASLIFDDYRGNNFISNPTEKQDIIVELNSRIALLSELRRSKFADVDFKEISTLSQDFEIQIETADDNDLPYTSISKRILKKAPEESKKSLEIEAKRFDELIKPITDIEEKISNCENEIKEISRATAPIMLEAQEMLIKWEQGDEEVISLWKKMNEWVYDGFDTTYKKIGVDFDKVYYESDTYLLGKDIVEEGLEKGVFYKKEDGSVWIDLTEEGMDHKLVLRGDGTSVYITQDLGTTDLKFKEYAAEKSLWVVGNEQDYHFKVLFAILKRLGRSYADGCYHLSYGMVDLPSGKMKSREGTVVDADELVDEMVATAKAITEEKGKTEGFTEEQLAELYRMVALGAIKYYLLKVEPKKRMLFNPEESIDFQGNTGPFIQYTHARIRSILRKSGLSTFGVPADFKELNTEELELIFLLKDYTKQIQNAASEYSPALIANYVYELAKTFNSFYAKHSVLNEESESLKLFRLSLIEEVADTIKNGMHLLGIQVPEKM